MAQEKHFYTISEVSHLCNVKPHVLRYWEKEFTTLQPSTRSGRRRYYQAHDIEHIHTIRRLLYDEGFTINGARARLNEEIQKAKPRTATEPPIGSGGEELQRAISHLDEILAML